MDFKQIRDNLEGCRPDSDDLHSEPLRETAEAVAADPQLARQFDQQQRHDAQLAHVIRGTSAPSGLADRILARLAESTTDETPADQQIAAPLPLGAEFDRAESDAPPTTTPAAASPQEVTSSQSGSSRNTPSKKLLYGALALAASLLLIVGVGNWLWSPSSEVSSDIFRKQVQSWEHQLRPSAWTVASAHDVQQKYPYGYMLVPGRGYQMLDPQLADASELVAYDFSTRNQQAYLFVAHTSYTASVVKTDGLPPSQSAALTAGWRMAAWREGPLLYVLLHDGTAGQYNQLIKTSGAIASVDAVDDRLVALR